MATQIIEITKVTLDDGRVLECKPLKIKYLRKFMSKIAELSDIEATDNTGSLDVLLDCCEIAISQYVKEGISKDILEEILDLPQMYRIIEGASGIVLDDKSVNPQ